jgi:hypothetical protein
MNNQISDSFKIVTYNFENNVLYLVDQVEKGLETKPPCSYPCKTCKPGEPSKCTSCFAKSRKPFL